MDIDKVVGFSLVASLLLSLLRRERPDMALAVSLAAGAAVAVALLPGIVTAVRLLEHLAEQARIPSPLLGTVFRIVGVTYLADFGAQACRDAGEGGLAAKVELAGKVLILILAIPIVNALLSLVLRLFT